MNNFIRRIRPEKTGVRAPLGDLEQAVMRYLWGCGSEGTTGAQVQQALEQERSLALTTVLTTLERLRDKGILQRKRERKSYRYRPLLTEEQLQQRIVEGVLGDLIARFPKAVAAYFAQQECEETAQSAKTGTLAELSRRLEAMEHSPRQENHDGA